MFWTWRCKTPSSKGSISWHWAAAAKTTTVWRIAAGTMCAVVKLCAWIWNGWKKKRCQRQSATRWRMQPDAAARIYCRCCSICSSLMCSGLPSREMDCSDRSTKRCSWCSIMPSLVWILCQLYTQELLYIDPYIYICNICRYNIEYI